VVDFTETAEETPKECAGKECPLYKNAQLAHLADPPGGMILLPEGGEYYMYSGPSPTEREVMNALAYLFDKRHEGWEVETFEEDSNSGHAFGTGRHRYKVRLVFFARDARGVIGRILLKTGGMGYSLAEAIVAAVQFATGDY